VLIGRGDAAELGVGVEEIVILAAKADISQYVVRL
jgi:hypothetical protein